MKQDKIKSYTARVAQANRSELVVISYEIILDSIEEAKAAYGRDDLDAYVKELKRVQKVLNELMGSLDYKYEVSIHLRSLYVFANKQVVSASFSKDVELLNRVTPIIEKLLAAFSEVAKEDTSHAVMENSQTLYAGLTYGRNALDEVLVNVNESKRGFRA